MGKGGSTPGDKADAMRARQVIIDNLKTRGMNLKQFAGTIDARLDKLSPALLCTSPVTPSSVSLRIRTAEALGLDPHELWDPVFLTAKRQGPTKGLKMKALDMETMSQEEWNALPPRSRVKAVMKVRGLRSHKALAQAMGVHQRALTLAIYGMTDRHEMREKIAEFLDWPIDDLWPDDYRAVKPGKMAWMRMKAESNRSSPLFGFGDMRQMGRTGKAVEA